MFKVILITILLFNINKTFCQQDSLINLKIKNEQKLYVQINDTLNTKDSINILVKSGYHNFKIFNGKVMDWEKSFNEINKFITNDTIIQIIPNINSALIDHDLIKIQNDFPVKNNDFAKKLRNNTIFGINYKYLLVGTGVILGGLSIYYKNIANDYYFKNQDSGLNINLVNKYDSISAIFLSLLQVDLLALTILLLTE